MKSPLIFNIAPLMEAIVGTRECYSFDMPLEFEDFLAKSNVTGKAEIMKIENGFNAKIEDLELKIEFNCKRCLKKFSETVHVKMSERQYLLVPPSLVQDTNDLYLVNKKDQTLDLGEFLRQEIILHFPLIPLCSKHCKGLCPVCGKNRNKVTCHCKIEEKGEEKPLAALKNLFRNS